MPNATMTTTPKETSVAGIDRDEHGCLYGIT